MKHSLYLIIFNTLGMSYDKIVNIREKIFLIQMPWPQITLT